MSQRERADKLAKAIDDLLAGREPEMEDEELAQLLQIARIRHEVGQDAATAGAPYQGIVWERLAARIGNLLARRGHRPNDININNEAETAGVYAAPTGPTDDPDSAEWRDIMSLRRRMTEDAMETAEAYRDVVWQRVQSRIEAHEARQAEKRGLPRWRLPFFTRRQQGADELAEAVDQMILGEPIWEAEDSKLKELLQTAQMRHALSRSLTESTAPYQARLWAHLRPRLMANLDPDRSARPRSGQGRRFGFGAAACPKLAAMAAGLALLIFAIGPLPATGC